jgi:hypothetical protein
MATSMFNQATYTVIYPAGGINAPVTGYSPQEIKDQLAQTYSELRNAEVVVDGTTVTFRLPTGTKNA